MSQEGRPLAVLVDEYNEPCWSRASQLMLERLITLQQNNSAAGFRKASPGQCSLVGLPAGSELAEVLATALEHQEQTRLSYQP